MANIFNSLDNCIPGTLGPSLTEICSASEYLVFIFLLNALTRNNDKVSGKCERVKPVETPEDKYDFVIVGGGAAGSVLAARLSEISNWKILLLEAGPDEPSGAQIPSFGFKFLETGMIWNYATSNESYACLSTNGSCSYPSGRNLGGNTVHNGMAYVRGNPTDYNNWADLGNEEWRWNEVERYFLKFEDNGEIERVGTIHHATGGPLSVERFPHVPDLAKSILDASSEAGFGVSEDLNGVKKTGFTIIQAMQKKGVRRSSARAYLWPNRNRRNLHVSLNSIVTRLIIENDRAVGVEYYKNDQRRSVRVTREVIVSSGTIRSPHLLLLSGIGPKEQLESMGIEVAIDLPGVGENLHDHPTSIIPFTINEPDTYVNDMNVAREYLATQTGPLSGSGMNQVMGILASNATTPDHPDIQLYMYGYFPTCAPGGAGVLQSTGPRNLGIIVSYLHPESKGRIALSSNDPFEYPKITVNYLAASNDIDRMVEGVRMALRLLDTKALHGYNITISETRPKACSNLEFRSDEYWACFVRQSNFNAYHIVGTCKMGPASDPMAVVDQRLRVHKIRGLRVVDASIMPEVISGNTAAPTMMIAERASDFIKKDWNLSASDYRTEYEEVEIAMIK